MQISDCDTIGTVFTGRLARCASACLAIHSND